MDELHNYPNLIIVRSFSKAFSAAGLRFGYLISSQENTKELNKVMPIFHSSLLVQAFALAILHHQADFLQHVEQSLILKQKLHKELNAIAGIDAKMTQTNFLPFTTSKPAHKIFDHLVSKDISIRPMGGHKLLEGLLRVTVATAEENKQFIRVLKEAMEE